MAIPIAGFLVGLVVLMLSTHHAAGLDSIGPKAVGAVVIVVVGAVASVAVTVIVAALTMVVMVVLMVRRRTAAGPRPARRVTRPTPA